MKLFSHFLLRTGLAVITAASALSAHAANLGNLPLWFEAQNPGTDNTRFIAHGQDSEFAITSTGAEFSLRRTDGHQASVQMSFQGASAAHLAGDMPLAGKVNYLLGSDPAQWRSGIPTFGKVRLDQIYPGVNVVYYGNQQKLEYDFNLAAGVNPDTIAIRFDGAEKLSLNAAGELVIQLDGGQIVQHQPLAYQTFADGQHPVKVAYQIIGSRTAKFSVGTYDHTQPLVIDPVLGYSTYFGGNNGEIAHAIAINPTDNSVYIAGQTTSTLVSNGPPVIRFATTNAAYTNFSGGIYLGDAFVAKFDSTGTNLLYCTYLGGSADDGAYGLAVDAMGHAFITGYTDSTNFPTTNALHYANYDGSHISGNLDSLFHVYPSDAFVAEIETNGSSLVYSTYLGGSEFESAFAIAIDAAGDAFVTGYTSSTNFIVTTNFAYQTHHSCSNNIYANENAFIAEIAANGKNLNYSSYFGGTNFDFGTAIACVGANVYLAGYTASTNFPWTNGLVANTNLNGFTNATPGSDAFISMFAASGTNLLLQYSTFLGSSNNDMATGITADGAGNAYVVGWTTSTNFPNSTNGLQLYSFVRTNGFGFVFATNAFITKIGWNGGKATNSYSQIFGGLGIDVANGVALDSAGNIFITGTASSTNIPAVGFFPVSTNRSMLSTNSGGNDAFVTVIAANLNSLLYSTYIGGNADDFGYGIAVDTNGDAWITGQTLSTNYPVLGTWLTNGPAVHRTMVGTNDAFLTKIVTGALAPNLGIKVAPSNTNDLVVTWPITDTNYPPQYVLQTTTNLLMYLTNNQPVGTTNWTAIATNLVLTNGNYNYTFVPTNLMQFFRLHH